MKIALINDTHFGCRNDNPNYHEYIYRFWEEQFFPYIKEHNIDTIIHLGDVLDRRKYVNFKTLQDFNKKIVEKFDKFDSAAESVGKLNALLGGPYLNTLELVAETDPLVGFNVTVNAAAPIKANNVASTFADAKS